MMNIQLKVSETKAELVSQLTFNFIIFKLSTAVIRGSF
jgi:hypothetical protein